MRRRFFCGADETPLVATSLSCWAVNPPEPSASRNPQFRQNRKSDGIIEWQFEQVVWFEVTDTGIVLSEFCVIGDSPVFVLAEEYTARFYTPNNLFRLHCGRLRGRR
jgi:hypothetical protein